MGPSRMGLPPLAAVKMDQGNNSAARRGGLCRAIRLDRYSAKSETLMIPQAVNETPCPRPRPHPCSSVSANSTSSQLCAAAAAAEASPRPCPAAASWAALRSPGSAAWAAAAAAATADSSAARPADACGKVYPKRCLYTYM